MGEYDRQIATAKRLIAQKGRKVVWRKHAPGVLPDAAKPWEPGSDTTTDYPVTIVFLPEGLQTRAFMQTVLGTDIVAGFDYGLMAAVSFAPTIKDEVYDEAGAELLRTVQSVDPLAPNGDIILYTLRFGVQQ